MMSIFGRIFKKTELKKYSVQDVFGCTEIPPQDCPTFLERDVHRQFINALNSRNIIVVFGESRQGKTWTIERYCPQQLRIGCRADMSLKEILLEMLHIVGVDVFAVEHSVTDGLSYDETKRKSVNIGNASNKGAQMAFGAGMDFSHSASHTETLTATYPTINIDNTNEVLKTIKDRSEGKAYVFDNFHYLMPEVQQQFCALLKEFNYFNIKIIIVGVWKDASRITALAPDLVNRCEHIDIGTWSKEELMEVLGRGAKALNVVIDQEINEQFQKCCASNIGIYKDFVQKFFQENGIFETVERKTTLIDTQKAHAAMEKVVSEALVPIHDRIFNLALPQKIKKDSKYLRMKIVISILQLIVEQDVENTQNGFLLSEIRNKMDALCREIGDEPMDIGNITLELGNLHTRVENKQIKTNFIPLFYYDKANKKLLVLEPTFYEIKEYNQDMLSGIIDELKQAMVKKEINGQTNMFDMVE